MDGLVFSESDSELKVVPVAFRGRDLKIREATADAAAQWRTAMFKALKQDVGLADSQILLVSLCLFEGADFRPVPKGEVKTWPGRVIGKMFDVAMKISGLDGLDTVEDVERRIKELTEQRDKMLEDSAKNSPSAAPESSA